MYTERVVGKRCQIDLAVSTTGDPARGLNYYRGRGIYCVPVKTFGFKIREKQ